MGYIDAGSTKKVGKYELMLSRPIGRRGTLELTIYKYKQPDNVMSRRKVYSTGYVTSQLAIDIYKKLSSAKLVEGYLRHRITKAGETKDKRIVVR